MPSYWLVKSEPDVYSIDDLKRDKKTCWEGVRNYQARNNLQKMKKGDLVLYYHSNAKPSGVVGVAKVVREAYPDHHALEKGHKYYDPKESSDSPRWFMVDVGYVKKFPRLVDLKEIKGTKSLRDMVLVRNSRLSVQPVKPAEFRQIEKMASQKV